MKRIGLILAAVFGAACSSPEDQLVEQAKQQIIAGLKDPDSAKFRNVRWEQKEALVLLCGEVNAKNALGGYVGFQPFWAAQPGLVETGKFDPAYALKINMNSKGLCR